MAELINQTLNDIMQMSAEDIALGKDPFDSVSAWQRLLESMEKFDVEYND